MATQQQSDYIADLAVKKTKDFKEVKELVVSAGIMGDQTDAVTGAQTIADLTNAMSDYQASRFIDALIASKTPDRGQAYSKTRINAATGTLEDIKQTIKGWSFPA
jgi:hypothetical protein